MRLDQDTLRILSGAIIIGDQLKITERLDRDAYVKVNKALEAAGGKWNRKAQAHVFTEEIGALIDDLCILGEITDRKKVMQQFFTPDALATDVVARANILPGMRILEPSAGRGDLVAAAVRAHGAEILQSLSMKELDPALAAKLQQRFPDSCLVQPGDFLESEPQPIYDRVIMNPPFTRRQDIAHVLHAWQFLNPAGHLVAIMAAGVEFRQDSKAKRFRAMVDEYGGYIQRCPGGSFKASGTMVNTVMVTIPA